MAHPHAHQLAYALDVNFNDCYNIKEVHVKAAKELESAMDALRDLGIIIKGNTLFRVLGMTALTFLGAAGFKIFADYKAFDVRSTLQNDASWLRLFPNISILTVSERVHPDAFVNFAKDMPGTVIAPIDPLTDLSDAEFKRRGEVNRGFASSAFFKRVAELPASGIICSPRDLQYAPPGFATGRTIITPAIRPKFATIEGDTNAGNALTPRDAILAGSDCLVLGSPLRHNGTLRSNALRVLDEIAEAMEERARS